MEDHHQQQQGRASNKIRDIVRLQQLLKRWKKIATGGGGVPKKGSFAVYVGEEMRRFVIPTEYLGHWAFEDLLRDAEEEFGFRHDGAIRIPCDVAAFEATLRLVKNGANRSSNDSGMCSSCSCSCSSETEILKEKRLAAMERSGCTFVVCTRG
uniref:Uncharacterized protein n=1 Tax=Leersia perrieri TaxID=77586 RepID=A0A0D9WTT3_9ORYZ